MLGTEDCRISIFLLLQAAVFSLDPVLHIYGHMGSWDWGINRDGMFIVHLFSPEQSVVKINQFVLYCV